MFFIPVLMYYLYKWYYTNMLTSMLGICFFFYILFYVISLIWFDCDVTLAFYAKFGKSIGSKLKGKVVFITGASSGIGEYTALALAKNGVRLVLAARRKTELERVKAECLAASEGKLTSDDIYILPMDVVKYDLHQQYFDEALRHFGQIDILVNNAGRSQRAQWENIELSVDKDMFDINVFGVLNLSRIAVKYFESEKREGHIAVTSSTVGVMVLPFASSYIGTKHALHGYFNCLRSEKMANNISVTLLCPGPTFTNHLPNCFVENKGETYGKTTSPTDKRMSAERCGHLCAVALANKLDESWMAVFPIIPIMYLSVYTPILFKFIVKVIGPDKLHKLREGKMTLNYHRLQINNYTKIH